MALKKKTNIARNAVIANTMETSVSKLRDSLEQVEKAVTARSNESKKLMLETRRLKKRRVVQMGKKKRAVAANKKNGSAESGKALKTIKSELAATMKVLVNTTASRQAVLEELSSLKESQKMLRAYIKSINAAERAMGVSKR